MKSQFFAFRIYTKVNRKIWLLFFGFSLVGFFHGKLCGAVVDKTLPAKKGHVWSYMVIHHSATKRGNAGMFEKYHRARGMKNGMAYHFVIDNGTCGKRDGQLEIGTRWKKQLPGGHCRQEWLNEAGIGICLVGDFTKKPPSYNQMRTLTNLVSELRKRYNIQMKNITGHGKVKGEKSQCPGRKFPWQDFYSALKKIK